MKFTLVATVKDEGPYLWEWVAYHRMIGFDRIIIFQNNSTDHTHDILSAMARHGLVTYKYNKAPRGQHQLRAYKRAATMPEYLDADWVMALDLDEFLVIHAGEGTLPELVDAMPPFDCAFINWLRFGNSDHVTPPDQLVSEAFTKCDDRTLLSKDIVAFKSLFKNASFGRPGVHRPRGKKIPDNEIRFVNGSGLNADEFKLKNFRCSDPAILRYAQVNHYIVRDAASFVLKSAKGSAHQADRIIGQHYWKKRNMNSSENFDLANKVARIKVAMQEIDEVTGGQLSKLTLLARERHQKAFKDTLEETWAQALYQYCSKNYVK